MHDDAARARYFGGLSIFMFSMLGIVFADNLFMMFIFWELVGFSSWLLINHYLHRQEAADAAKKAFIVNRVGDFGFLLGIVWCYAQFGTTNLNALATAVEGGKAVATGIPLLLFCGAIGKSAQIPLHVWLPDAMEGPTPVSALIHAATMVAAGIYMLCRINVLMVADALTVIMWVGAATALYAAICAITQRDIKKVLAYSTLSQLGYMVAAFGLGSLSDAHDGVTRLVREGLRFDKYLVATSCRQCRDPLCMVGCPVGSIRRRNSLEIIIEDWCIGCGLCANNCPYGNLNMHPFEVKAADPAQPSRQIASTKRKATGCDLCMELEEPSCVYACPHDAAKRVEPLTFFASMRGAGDHSQRRPGAGTEATSK